MSKFNFAGVSRRNGTFKVRFANDQMRVKVLAKTGSSDIDLIELMEPMTKDEAVAYLIRIDFATRDGVTNQEIKAALEAAQEQRLPKEPKVKVPKEAKVKVAKAPKEPKTKVPKAKVAKEPSLDAIMARATVATDPALEDAPY